MPPCALGAPRETAHGPDCETVLIAPVESSTSRTPDRRSSAGRGVAALVALAGILGAVTWAWLAVVRVNGRVDALTRVEAPGEATVQVALPGTFQVYLEGDGELRPGDIAVASPIGDAVAVRYDDRGREYSSLGRVGRPVASFEADVPGPFLVTVGASSSGSSFTIGDGRPGRVQPGLAGAGGLLLASVGLAALIVVRTIGRRSRSVIGAPR